MLIAAILALVVTLVSLKLLSFTGDAPVRAEVVSELPGCPATPNCVSSIDADDQHRVAPIEFTGDSSAALARLDAVLAGLGGSRERATEGYRHYTFRSRWMNYIDDVELLMDTTGQRIEIRSASRSGYGDFGVNRRRVETIREAFRAAERLESVR